jgi:hypothetical protein
LARAKAGNKTAASMAMTAITTKSSINVKALERPRYCLKELIFIIQTLTQNVLLVIKKGLSSLLK